ncbi:MAG: alkaline phosphatase [Hyphomicrobiales bacterium]
MKKIILLGLSIFIALNISEVQAQDNKNKPKKVKNIILMIGDGMGTSQVYAAMVAKKGDLNMTKTKHMGFSKTYSASDFVTDSGAGGTAIAIGMKANNKSVGVDKDYKPRKSILEIAEENGLSTGLVATAAITHATPASFIAHNKSRKNYEEIASDFLKTDIDVFIGGGLKHFSKRDDKQNLVDSLKARNYSVVTSIDDLQNSEASKIAGLLYEKHPPKLADGRGDMLEKASMKAIEVLSKNDDGFFLMIEGSQIDWGGHDNNTDYIVEEAVDFDNTIGKVVDWAEKEGNTLVLITADHETGGMAIKDGDIEKGEVKGKYTTYYHSGVMVPVFAFGPGARRFQGIQENTDLFYKMCRLLKLPIPKDRKK